MANWEYVPVLARDEFSNGYAIRKCISRFGDSHSGRTFATGNVGIHWLTKGSVHLLNASGDKVSEFGPGVKFVHSNPDDYLPKKTILISKELTHYFCICDPKYIDTWDGEVLPILAEQVMTLTDIQNKRIFISLGEVEINGTVYPKETVLNITSTNTLDIKAVTNDALIVTFYKVVP